MDKELFVFAGANGSGKSTVAKLYLEAELCPAKFICPDQLVALDKKSDRAAYASAMNLAEQMRHTEIAAGNSFSFETVLSRPDKLEFIKYAKAQGYNIVVAYIITSNPEINLARIKRRVEQGGHDVPSDKVIARYERAMQLMFSVIEEADDVIIYNNSQGSPKIAFIKDSEGYFCYEEPDTPWVEKYLVRPANEKGIELKFEKL